MIILFTDFGWNGPYVGQMKAVLSRLIPSEPVIDLLHDAPGFNIKASSYLLASLVHSFPGGSVFLSVIDPGVGSERLPCVVEADSYLFVGPDNGLFDPVLMQAKNIRKWEITWCPESLSKTFHGRDLFAPVAAEIASGNLDKNNKLRETPVKINTSSADLFEIIYIDNYGNCMTGVREGVLSRRENIVINNAELPFAHTFSEVKQGQAFWFINSNGICEIAVNQSSAKELLGINIGDRIKFKN